MKRYLTVALALAICSVPLQAATLERLTLDDMIAKSTAIVRGTVADTWTAFTGRNIYTHYKLNVSERFKGPIGRSVEIIVPGGTVGDLHQTVAGSPVLNKGEEFVFFLWTSKAGATWIMGLTQGLFCVAADSPSDPSANRPANRELMLDPDSGHPVRDNAVSMKMSVLRSRIATRLGQSGLQ